MINKISGPIAIALLLAGFIHGPTTLLGQDNLDVDIKYAATTTVDGRTRLRVCSSWSFSLVGNNGDAEDISRMLTSAKVVVFRKVVVGNESDGQEIIEWLPVAQSPCDIVGGFCPCSDSGYVHHDKEVSFTHATIKAQLVVLVYQWDNEMNQWIPNFLRADSNEVEVAPVPSYTWTPGGMLGASSGGD